jgi:hypothetical protein
MDARLTAMLSGALLLAAASPASAESIATGCLAKNGTINNLGMYSNNPRAKCRKGEEIIRLAVQQPDTVFSKQRVTIPAESGAEMASFTPVEGGTVTVVLDFHACAIGCDFDPNAPLDACELYLAYQDPDSPPGVDRGIYLMASVPPGGRADLLTYVDVFGEDGRSAKERTVTNGLVRNGNGLWALRVHELLVENSGAGCFATYVMEFADDESALYSR